LMNLPDRLVVGLRSETYSGCRIATLAGAYRQVVHVLFDIIILVIIASGLGMMALSVAAPLIFGGEGALLPDFWKYPPRLPHGIGAQYLGRPSRWCRSLSSFRSPRRSALAHVVQ
jgi:hypothetical protein